MSDNPIGAGNQQESLSPEWVVVSSTAEGCFYVGVNRQPSMKLGWQVLPEFRVVQHERDVALLEQLREFFRCGQITVNHGDRKELRIRGLKDLSERVAPFFKAHPLRTVKRSSFECFAEVIQLMQRGDHLTMKGLTRIRELAGRMNRGSQNPQRPYAGSPT
jgi:LAGLIDADG endonuclease